MAARFLVSGLATSLALTAFAGAARADDQADLKKLVQGEIKSYMDKKKEDDTKDMVFKAKWKNGLYFETPDKKYTARIGGRIHLDTVFSTTSDTVQNAPPVGVGEFDGATYFRRARIYVAGDLTQYVDYKLQFDFATPNDPKAKDVFITLKGMQECFGCWMPKIRAGQWYDPMGLETFSSSNHDAFIERSLTTALHPDRAIGLTFFNDFWKKHATYQLGIYSPSQADDNTGVGLWDQDNSDGGYAVTGRMTFLPLAQDTCHFIHLGAAASYRKAHSVRFQARPGLGRGPFVADTAAITNPTKEFEWNAELAAVWGSFHAAAEYTSIKITDAPHADPTFNAWYVQAGWFVTGEAKGYNFDLGLWDNTNTCCNFLSNGCCCWGALEVIARVDRLDLNDGTVQGGVVRDIAFGFNWYLNPNTRLMFNYIISKTDDRNSAGVTMTDAKVNSFLMRWDVHF